MSEPTVKRLVPAEYTDVYLAGELGKKFGRKWRLVCPTPAHAMRLIGLAKPEFKKYMLEKAKEGIRFHVISDRRSRTEEQLALPSGKRLIISPEVAGAKGVGGSILEIVAAVALITASFYVGGPAGVAALGAKGAAVASSATIAIGMSLALAGITALLSPQSTPNTSYFFNGGSTTNTIQQGQPMQVVYGEMLVSGLPIYSSLTAVDMSNAGTESGLVIN